MKKNILLIDFIRSAASFSVVLLHSASPLLYEYNNINKSDWWAGNIYDSAVRSCVPLFFIISGYLLLGKQESIKDFLIKRMNKILIPFLVWSTIYIFWAHIIYNKELTFYNFSSIILSPAFFHLWFFYAIIGLYLCIPILRTIVFHSSKNVLYYYVILWFFAVAIIPSLEKTTKITSSIDLRTISGYSGYLIVGYLLRDIQVSKNVAAKALAVFILLLLTTAAGTFFLTNRGNGEFNDYFYDYLSPGVILLSLASFILLKYSFENINFPEKQQGILKAVSSASLGIYVLHPIILYVLQQGWLGFSLSGFSGSAIYSIPLTALVTFSLAFIVVNIIQRIPIIRNCVPS